MRVGINDKLIDKILAKAITGSTKKIIIVLCIPAALFSPLRVQQNIGKNAVPVIQYQNRKAAKEEQKSRL